MSVLGFEEEVDGQPVMIDGFNIHVVWDSESQMWIAASKSLGLITEADSIEGLFGKLKTLVPELLRENGFSTVESRRVINETTVKWADALRNLAKR
jgi:hypothetical protein